VATPTEAAGVGAVGATLLAGARKAPQRTGLFVGGVAAAAALIALNAAFDLRLNRGETPALDDAAIWASFGLAAFLGAICLYALLVVFADRTLHEVVFSTARITAMVFAVLIGASMFSLVFRGFGGDETVRAFLESLPGGLFGAMAFTMLLMFLMGFFLDFLEIIFIVVPIVCPILIVMGADPVWLGVMIAVNLQTSFLTPPFGFALFFLRGVTPPEVPTQAIYRGVVPFVAIQLLALCALAAFPQLGTWLPAALYGG
jgi:TRAP-type mannitol/chloroaromatic compound transport system permease large subunit